jgi:hypothetical protein
MPGGEGGVEELERDGCREGGGGGGIGVMGTHVLYRRQFSGLIFYNQ